MNILDVVNADRNENGETWKGLVAGAIGGIAGAVAMSLYDKYVLESSSSKTLPSESPVVKASNTVLEIVGKEPLTEEAAFDIAQVGRYPFGVLFGAGYGALVETIPLAKSNMGLGLSSLVYSAVNQTMAPKMSVLNTLAKNPLAEENREIVSLAIFGITTEFVRKGVRSLLG